MASALPILFGSGASSSGSSSRTSSSGGFDWQSILDTYRRLHEEANAANESRYQDILQRDAVNQERVGATYGQAFDLLENLGESQMEDIDIRGIRDFAAGDQDLTTRGLGNTTIRESMRRGVGEDVDRSKRGVAEQTGRQQAGVLQGRAGAEERMGNYLTSVMESRTDQGPDMSMLAGLFSQAGAGQGAMDAASSTINTGLSANARAGRDAFGQESGFQRPTSTTASGIAEDPRFGDRGGTGSPPTSAYITGPSGQRLPSGNGATFRGAASAAATGIGGGGAQGARVVTGGGTTSATSGSGFGGGGGGSGYITGPAGGFKVGPDQQPEGTGDYAGYKAREPQAPGTGSITGEDGSGYAIKTAGAEPVKTQDYNPWSFDRNLRGRNR